MYQDPLTASRKIYLTIVKRKKVQMLLSYKKAPTTMASGLGYAVVLHVQGLGILPPFHCALKYIDCLQVSSLLDGKVVIGDRDGLSLMSLFKSEDILPSCFPANFP